MSELISISLLGFHLVCVNVAAAGPCVAVWFEVRDARGRPFAKEAGRFLAGSACLSLIVGGLLGLALGGLKWDSDYYATLLLFERRLYFGIWELAFSLALMLGGWIWWAKRSTPSQPERWTRSILLLLAATNLLYHFPFLFTLISQAARNAAWAAAGPLSGADFRALIATPDVFAQVLHIWLASFAVTGTALVAKGWQVSPKRADYGHFLAVQGSRLALAATLAQLPSGIWLLLAQPPRIQRSLMGGDLTSSLLLALSVLISFTLLSNLATVAFGSSRRSLLARVVASMLAVVIFMSAVLHRL